MNIHRAISILRLHEETKVPPNGTHVALVLMQTSIYVKCKYNFNIR